MSPEARGVSSLFTTPFFLGFAGLFLFLGLLYGQRDLTVLSSLVFALMGALRLWSELSHRRTDCDVTVDKVRVFPGDEISFDASLANRKPLPVWVEIEVPLTGLVETATCGNRLQAEQGLLWYGRHRFSWKVCAEKRGIGSIGPLRIISGDLLGFFLKDRPKTGLSEIIIYPRLVPIRPFSIARREFFGVAGTESPVKDPVYILGTTDYRKGQPAKHIHWKASARHLRLQEKVFEASGQEKVLLIVDVAQFNGSGNDDDFERTLEAVASVAVQLDRRGCSVGLLTNGVPTGKASLFLTARKSPAQVSRILEALARLTSIPGSSMDTLISRGLAVPSGTSAAYFCLQEDGGTKAAGEHLRRLGIPAAFYGWDEVRRLLL